MLNLPDPEETNQVILNKGFTIIKNAVNLDVVEDIRQHWLQDFALKHSNKRFVRGNLIFGEKNFYSYSNTSEWCMYRHFDFLWNTPAHKKSRELNLLIHRYRNEIQGFVPDLGISINQDRYSIYISTSLYPVGNGMIEKHIDGHRDIPLLHYMLPLTFKGKDYSDGGLYLEDHDGKSNDIDAIVNPGDLIFFDGRCKHEVRTIKGNKGNQMGRLAVFAIPTFFERSAATPSVFLRSAKILARDIIRTYIPKKKC